MKRLLACVGLMVAAAALSGCYYDPGYTYVRGGGSAGDAYYGGYYGCCYAPGVSVGISSHWYGGSRYPRYHGRDYGRDYRHRDNDRGHYRDDGHSGHRDSQRGGRHSRDRDDRRHCPPPRPVAPGVQAQSADAFATVKRIRRDI